MNDDSTPPQPTDAGIADVEIDDFTPKEDDQTKRRGWMQIGAIGVVLLIAVVASGLLSSGREEVQVAARSDEVPVVEVTKPALTQASRQISETGTVQARNFVDLTPQVGGRVTHVSPNLAVGGSFRRGETLFRIDAAEVQALVAQRRASLLSAQSDLQVEQAEAEVARAEWALVYPGEKIPAIVARGPQIAKARAAVASAQANLRDAEIDLGRVTYTLPFSGKVASSTVELGKVVNAGQNYGQVYSIGNLEIRLPLSAADLQALQPAVGRTAQVVVREGRRDENYQARVVRVDDQLDADTRQASLILQFSGPRSLPPGTFVTVTLDGEMIDNVVPLPSTARGEDNIIWVVDKGKLAIRRPAIVSTSDKTIHVQNFDMADGVITSPLLYPKAGNPVQIAKPKSGKDK